MPTVIHALDQEYWEIFHQMCLGMYLDGGCYAFATALHRGLGWPMVGLMHGTEIRHVGVKCPDGGLCDARGFVPYESFGDPFGLSCPHELREVTEDELLREGETPEYRENLVRIALKTAEVLWPRLPWKKSFESKISDFANELETLSKKHGLWIRSPFPTAKPLITVGDGDEGGYEIRPTADGLTFSIDRYFS